MNLVVIVFSLLFSSLSFATTLKNIVVFGDSLSDNGNLYEYMQHQIPPSPPYFDGRFSDGPVWIEQLAERYYPLHTSSHFEDFAIGGAGIEDIEEKNIVFTLREQTDDYFSKHNDVADPKSLFVLWIGANNYFMMPKDVEEKVALVLNGIKTEVENLVQKGAKHILLINLPDLGKIPSAKEFSVEEELSYFSQRHNTEFVKLLAELMEQYPNVQWMYYDAHKAFDDLLQSPADYGFTNITDPCYKFEMDSLSLLDELNIFSQPSYPQQIEKHNISCKGYLFFDSIHSTVLGHEILARQVYDLLSKAGITFE